MQAGEVLPTALMAAYGGKELDCWEVVKTTTGAEGVTFMTLIRRGCGEHKHESLGPTRADIGDHTSDQQKK